MRSNLYQTSRASLASHSRMRGFSNSPQHHYFSSPKSNSGRLFSNGESNAGQRMRMMKSRAKTKHLRRQEESPESKIFPPELIFLLGNEDSNIEHFRKMIEMEKQKVSRDFVSLSREISHMVDDLKLSVTAELDIILRDFMILYSDLKLKVSHLRQNRRRIIEHNNFSEYYPQDNKKSHNQQSIPNNVSNLNYLQELSRDQEYFRNHQVYAEVTNAHMEAMGDILTVSNQIIQLGSEQYFYNNEKCAQIMKRIRMMFLNSTKQVFDSQLEILVPPTSNILHQHQTTTYEVNQKSQFVEIDRQSRSEHEGTMKKSFSNDHYGFPTFKNMHNIDKVRENSGKNRPSSMSEYHKLDFKSDQKKERKGSVSANGVIHQGPRANSHLTVTQSQQNIISDALDSLRLVENNYSLDCSPSKDIVLCCLFVNGGKFMAVGCKDSKIYVYNVQNGRLLAKLTGHKASICTLSNFGEFFASGGDSGCCSLLTWDSVKLQLRSKVKLHTAAITCIVDLLDGYHLATAGYDKRIIVSNYSSGELAFQVSSNKSSVSAMVLCAKSKKLVSSGLDLTLCVWNVFYQNSQIYDVKLQRIITECGFISVLRQLTLSPDFFIAGNNQGKIMLINLHSGEVFKTIAVGKSTILDMIVIERPKKPHYPQMITFISHQNHLLFTKIDSGQTIHLQMNNTVNIMHGCGISPTMAVENNGLFAVVSQSQNRKAVQIYKIQE